MPEKSLSTSEILSQGTISEDSAAVVETPESNDTNKQDQTIDFDNIFESTEKSSSASVKDQVEETAEESVDANTEQQIETTDKDVVDVNKPSTTDDEKEVTDDAEEVQRKETLDTKTVKVEQTTEKPAQLPVKQARDYTIFDQKDVQALKRCDNITFNMLKARLVELYAERAQAKELKTEVEKLKSGALPDAYYEHPEAFTLSKEYRQLSNQYSRTDFESQHYQRQLAAIKRGEKWTEITGYDQRGNPQLAEHEPGPEAEIAVLSQYNSLERDKQSLIGAVTQYQQSFINGHKASIANLKQATEQNISKLPAEYQPNDDDKKLYMTAFKQAAPAFANHPLVDHAATLFALCKSLMNHIDEIKKKAASSVVAANEKQKAGANFKSGGAKARPTNNKDTINFDEIVADMTS